MRNPLFLILLITTHFVSGCNSKFPNASSRRKADETKAQSYLDEAREALSTGNFGVAKSQIKALRDSCRYALEAREQAILLMDSIDIFAASKEMQKVDSLIRNATEEPSQELKEKYNELFQQVKFYQRKLQHDKQQRKHYD